MASIRGYIDHIGMTAIAGWAHASSKRPCNIEVFFGGEVIGRAIANNPRPDVASEIGGDLNCGFTIPIEPPYDVDGVEVWADGEPLARARQPAGFPDTCTSSEPGLSLRSTAAQGNSDGIEICRRLISTYRCLFRNSDNVYAGPSSMWDRLVAANYRQLYRIVLDGSPDELHEYLIHLHKRPETWGISQGPESYYVLSNSDAKSAAHRAHTEVFRRQLLRLGEYLRLLPVENSEQNCDHSTVDLAWLVRAVRDATGVDPIFPHRAGGLFCIDTGEGLVHQRDVWALYGALRVGELLSELETKRVCEIGGGLGQLCHYVRLLGARQYVLIDLPPVSLLQAFVLMSANPNCTFSLFDDRPFDTGADICIYPTFMFERAPDWYFDLTVNVDSMPEMGWDNATSYAAAARRKTSAFLSINQEARGPLGLGSRRQISVPEVFSHVGGFREVYRFPSWVRSGYVESYYVNDMAASGLAKREPANSPSTIASGSTDHQEGYLDEVGPELISGWARNLHRPEHAADVEVVIDNCVYSKLPANVYSRGLQDAGIGHGVHAFSLRTPLALFDGKPHRLGIRFAGRTTELNGSPVDVHFPSIVEFGPVIRAALPTEPWVIDRIELNGTRLTLEGWAIPPIEQPEDATFLVDNSPFQEVEWPLPRRDIQELYFFHPHASRSGFRLSTDIGEIFAAEAPQAVLRYARRSSGRAINPFHDFFLPLLATPPLPLPSSDQRKRVSGTTDAQLFDLGGFTLARKIVHFLRAEYQLELDNFDQVLDWGCGCGRLLRYLAVGQRRPRELYGADIDVDNVGWCEHNLPFVETCALPLMPPSSFRSGQFDLIIGNSVFTHLAEAAQFAWLDELARILAPGGLALVSVQSIAELTRETFLASTFERLLRSGFVSDKPDNALAELIDHPGYYRSAFHTHDYIRSRWSKHLSIENIIPQFSNNLQDLVVLRK